jgi:hypothetical protein
MSWLMVQLLACWANNANHYAFNLGWVVRTPMLQDVKRCVCVPQGFALSWFLAWRQNGTLRAARNPKKRRIKEVVPSSRGCSGWDPASKHVVCNVHHERDQKQQINVFLVIIVAICVPHGTTRPLICC